MNYLPAIKSAAKYLPLLPWEMLNQKKKIPLLTKYRHFKGGVYTVLMEQVHNEATGEFMTVYQGLDGTIWARPSNEFHSYVDGVRRFKPITPGEADA